MRALTRTITITLLTAAAVVAQQGTSFAQSGDDAIRRLEEKVDTLTQENATLRQRMQRLEAPALDSMPNVRAEARGATRPTQYRTNPWNGFYLGGSAGYGWSDVTTTTGNTSGTTAFNSSIFAPLSPGQYTTRNSGWMGGVLAGYNYEFDRKVIGVEADYNFGNIKGATSTAGVCSGFTGITPTNCSYAQSQKLNWLATLRGRFGLVVIPETMIYGTAGFALGHVDVSHSLYTAGFAGTVSASGISSTTKAGWVIGAGIESFLAPNWIARLEYLHYDLGTVNSNAPLLNPAPTGETSQTDFRVNGDIARASLIYKF